MEGPSILLNCFPTQGLIGNVQYIGLLLFRIIRGRNEEISFFLDGRSGGSKNVTRTLQLPYRDQIRGIPKINTGNIVSFLISTDFIV